MFQPNCHHPVGLSPVTFCTLGGAQGRAARPASSLPASGVRRVRGMQGGGSGDRPRARPWGQEEPRVPGGRRVTRPQGRGRSAGPARASLGAAELQGAEVLGAGCRRLGRRRRRGRKDRRPRRTLYLHMAPGSSAPPPLIGRLRRRRGVVDLRRNSPIVARLPRGGRGRWVRPIGGGVVGGHGGAIPGASEATAAATAAGGVRCGRAVSAG